MRAADDFEVDIFTKRSSILVRSLLFLPVPGGVKSTMLVSTTTDLSLDGSMFSSTTIRS